MTMKAPYASKTAGIGGLPTVGVDVPIDAVFLALFLVGAIAHMTIFQLNLRKGHRFMLQGLMFGFCMARITTSIMRIVWAVYPHEVRIALAAQIFFYAGDVILYVLNLLLALRYLATVRPLTGRWRFVSVARTVLIVLMILFLVALITTVIQSTYTLSGNTHRIDLDVQRAANTYNLFFALLPFPIIVYASILRRTNEPTTLGTGRWRTKAFILLFTTAVTVWIQGFRCGTTWMAPRPSADPAWYDAKWAFYIFSLCAEIVIIYAYLVARVDQRFHPIAKIVEASELSQISSSSTAVAHEEDREQKEEV